ncbi:hypothetical protein K491DRAFT_683615 [Lophiostoma macrostomum CBS 122681]|uniref:F-box domain-containing protein n=1 Tax=Lophiostoma macrostomum CBS 122681 TaxID=1314788 RepID=A0A6A6SPF7_9PLEO|nr:hypothetical protein K491DRAFT_683615 [Lophiostoma macrostomum CBS 122681]
MSTLQSLPDELLLATFNFLDQNTLRNLCLVSRDVSRVSTDVMYRCITINNGEQHFGSPVKNLAMTVMERPDLADKLRGLSLTMDCRGSSTVDKPHQRDHSGALDFIQDRLGGVSAWKDLIDDGHEGAWAAILVAHVSKLEAISMSRGTNCRPSCLDQFQKMVKALFDAGKVSDIGSNVSFFPKLRRLKIDHAELHWYWFGMAELNEVFVERWGQLPFYKANCKGPPCPHITSLAYNWHHGGVMSLHLTETQSFSVFLTFCRHLTKLRLNTLLSFTIDRPYGIYDLYWERAIHVLSPLASTLEDLDFTVVYKLIPPHTTTRTRRSWPLASLKDFHRLRRLAAPQEAFMGLHLTPSRLENILPKNIETLKFYQPKTTILPLVAGVHHSKEQFPKLEDIYLHVDPHRGDHQHTLTTSSEYSHIQNLGLSFRLSIVSNEEYYPGYIEDL